MVSSAETWCGGASSRREPSSMPAGYASQTGYQYDSISRVAGQRELAPPSKFSKEGGFKNSVFKGMLLISISYHLLTCRSAQHPTFRTLAGAGVGREVASGERRIHAFSREIGARRGTPDCPYCGAFAQLSSSPVARNNCNRALSYSNVVSRYCEYLSPAWMRAFE